MDIATLIASDDQGCRTDLFVRFDYEFKNKQEALDRLKEFPHSGPRTKRDIDIRLSLYAQLLAPYVSVDDWISIPLNSNRYPSLSRYNGPQFRYRGLMREVCFGEKHGLIEIIRALPNSHKSKDPKQSIMRATPKLRALLCNMQLQFVLHDPIRLNESVDVLNNRVYERKVPGRTYKRRLKKYRDSPEIAVLRNEIREINDFLRTIQLQWVGVDQKKSGRYVVFDDEGFLQSPLHIIRVFARGRFDCYGRCHGFWQGQKKWLRQSIRLNGMETCEPDYSAIHAIVAYLEKGIAPPEDPYDIEGFDRELVKRTFAILLNAGDFGGALSAVSTKFSITEIEASDVIEAVKDAHSPIVDLFHADAGIRLMRIDSDICVAVMLKLVRERIPFLPIHDGFRVPICHEKQVKGIMVRTFKERYPGFTCKVKS